MDTLAGRSLPYYIVHQCPNNVNTYTWYFYLSYAGYRKIPKVSPSKYKPPNPVMQKTLHQIAPPNISPVACTWKFALKYNEKRSKNGEFTSNYETNPIDFEMQISLRR